MSIDKMKRFQQKAKPFMDLLRKRKDEENGRIHVED